MDVGILAAPDGDSGFAFCDGLKLHIVPVYDPADLGRKNRRRVRRGEQAQHRVGDCESVGKRGREIDF